MSDGQKPIAYGMARADGLILDVITPEEHESHAGEYTVPLYAAPPAAPQPEPVAWRCFHCDESFTDAAAAREHFGKSEHHSPACTIDIAEYRSMEERVQRANADDLDTDRAMYAMQSQHQVELLREEEKGYARGLRDGKRPPQADMRTAPKVLNTNDKAMWVSGWNDCLDAMPATPPAVPVAPWPNEADPYTYIIQHLNSSQNDMTKAQCIRFIEVLRDRYTAPPAAPDIVNPITPAGMAPNNDEVICPNCAHQFRAIPVNVQQLLLASGHEPPFLAAAPADQTTSMDYGMFVDEVTNPPAPAVPDKPENCGICHGNPALCVCDIHDGGDACKSAAPAVPDSMVMTPVGLAKDITQEFIQREIGEREGFKRGWDAAKAESAAPVVPTDRMRDKALQQATALESTYDLKVDKYIAGAVELLRQWPAPAVREPLTDAAQDYDWMPEARQAAAQCWCDPETSRTEMDVALAESIARRIAAWMQTGAFHARNEAYWRDRCRAAEAYRGIGGGK